MRSNFFIAPSFYKPPCTQHRGFLSAPTAGAEVTSVPIPLSTSGTDGARLQRVPSTFRQDWPFLSNHDCPPELKILASEKINTYQQYVRKHQELFDTTNARDQFTTVRDLVEAFIENRLIHKEFEYYKEHGHVLALHSIFKEYADLRKLRKLSPIELFKQKERLEHNIWRTRKKLDIKGQEHLRISREKSIEKKERELAEINRLLNL